MHELGIANSLMETVRREMAKLPGARLSKIGVRIGEFAAVDEASLRFCFETLARDTEMRDAVLAVERGQRDELDLSYLEVEQHEPDPH